MISSAPEGSMVTSCKKGEHQDLEGGDSLDGCVGYTGLYPAAPSSSSRGGDDLQDAASSRSRPHSSGLVLNVEHLEEVANPSMIERADLQQSECLQITEGEVEVTEHQVNQEQSIPILGQISQNFTWENFYYAFFFGLLPTAWDISTDLQFGVSQEGQGEETTAGFCYMFICLPAIFSLIPAGAPLSQEFRMCGAKWLSQH